MRMFRGNCGQPKDGSPPLLLSDCFPDEDSWAAAHWVHLSPSGPSLAPLESFSGYFSFKRCLAGCLHIYSSNEKHIKPLVKYTATLIHYFWCNHTHNFLVAQQKEHLWFHSPAVLTSHCGQEQGILEVCCVLEGMEHCERGARRFILRALTRQC